MTGSKPKLDIDGEGGESLAQAALRHAFRRRGIDYNVMLEAVRVREEDIHRCQLGLFNRGACPVHDQYGIDPALWHEKAAREARGE